MLARAAVFGVNDGLVSNVSLLLGFAGCGVDAVVVRLAGLAGAVAGGDLMAAGEWISVSAQNELIERELDVERRELRAQPEAETAELAAMYEPHGMTPTRARAAAADVMRRPDEALVVHAREEFGIDPDTLAVAVAGGRALARVLPVRRVPAGDPVVRSAASGTAPKVVSVVDRRRGGGGRRLADRPVRRAPVGASIAAPGGDRARRLRVTYVIGELVGVSV